MKLRYYPDTDSLYIDLAVGTSFESNEVSEGIVLDYDQTGNLVGIGIDKASHKLDLSALGLAEVLPAPTPCVSRSLQDVMDGISHNAEANGLTPEILNSLLKSE